MKLVVQIPCLNEEATIATTIGAIPRQVPGFDEVLVLIIDDGSTDRTVEEAWAAGADHIVSFPRNRGLAAAFMTGLDASLALGADVIVHTDADNQYDASCISDLVAPILEQRADIVVGVRPIEQIEDFSWLKKRLQRLGSRVVRQISRTDVADTTSGFRAYSREAACRLSVVSAYTYTLETLIQAGRTGMAVAQVPVRTNPKTRESRLFQSVFSYVWRSARTILRIYAVYAPFGFFTRIGLAAMVIGVLPQIRWFWFYLHGVGRGHLQSLVLGTALMTMGFQICVLGVLAELMRANRQLLQDLLYREKRRQAESALATDSALVTGTRVS